MDHFSDVRYRYRGVLFVGGCICKGGSRRNIENKNGFPTKGVSHFVDRSHGTRVAFSYNDCCSPRIRAIRPPPKGGWNYEVGKLFLRAKLAKQNFQKNSQVSKNRDFSKKRARRGVSLFWAVIAKTPCV